MTTKRGLSPSRNLRTFVETWSLDRSIASRVAEEMWGVMNTFSSPLNISRKAGASSGLRGTSIAAPWSFPFLRAYARASSSTMPLLAVLTR